MILQSKIDRAIRLLQSVKVDEIELCYSGGCPLKSDNGLSDFKATPSLVKAWLRAGLVWWDKPREKEIKSKAKFGDIYGLFVHNLFFDTYEDFRLATSGMFGRVDGKRFLEKYFNIEL